MKRERKTMKTPKRSCVLAVAFSALLGAAGCQKQPIATERTDNVEISVSKLFTYDGCTVYRFYDGNTRYFSKCETGYSSTAFWSESCGKNCTREVEVPST